MPPYRHIFHLCKNYYSNHECSENKELQMATIKSFKWTRSNKTSHQVCQSLAKIVSVKETWMNIDMCLRHYFLMGCPGLFCFLVFSSFYSIYSAKKCETIKCPVPGFELTTSSTQDQSSMRWRNDVTSHLKNTIVLVQMYEANLCRFKCRRTKWSISCVINWALSQCYTSSWLYFCFE